MGVKRMIDFATLTGACIVALGCIRTGVMSNHDEFCDEWLAASKKAGEKMWRLPMDAEFFDLLKSDTADMVNCTEIGEAGTVTAAKFLEQFVEKDTQWIHNDIAGTSDIHRTQGIYPKGPTGVGVRTVIALLRSE
jgi:leucyl aminopeptidase